MAVMGSGLSLWDDKIDFNGGVIPPYKYIKIIEWYTLMRKLYGMFIMPLLYFLKVFFQFTKRALTICISHSLCITS